MKKTIFISTSVLKERKKGKNLIHLKSNLENKMISMFLNKL